MRLIRQAAVIAALTVVWLLLWRRWSAGTVTGGVLVSAAAYYGSRLPPASGLGRVHPVAALAALADIVRELVLSSLTLAWHALRHPGDPAAAVVAVPVRAESDVERALVAGVVSLTPGTLVVGFDSARRLLHVHGMPVHDRAEAETLRRRVAGVERRLDRAFGRQHDDAGDRPEGTTS